MSEPTEHTPAPWEWWTSNSWKRLRHSERGVSTNVLMPCRLPDGGVTIDVTKADMALIAAAPDLFVFANHPVLDFLFSQTGIDLIPEPHRTSVKLFLVPLRDAAIAKATGAKS